MKLATTTLIFLLFIGQMGQSQSFGGIGMNTKVSLWIEQNWKEIGSQTNGATVTSLIHYMGGPQMGLTKDLRKDPIVLACKEKAMQGLKDYIRQMPGKEKLKQTKMHVMVNVYDYRDEKADLITKIKDQVGLGVSGSPALNINYTRAKDGSHETLNLDSVIRTDGTCDVPSQKVLAATAEDYYKNVKVVPVVPVESADGAH